MTNQNCWPILSRNHHFFGDRIPRMPVLIRTWNSWIEWTWFSIYFCSLSTVLKTLPLSAKLASANTFVNFASISSSLCMVIFTSSYRTHVRSLPCLLNHSACKSSLWDLTDVNLTYEDSRNLCLPYLLLSLLTTMLLMSEHNALPCLVDLLLRF